MTTIVEKSELLIQSEQNGSVYVHTCRSIFQRDKTLEWLINKFNKSERVTEAELVGEDCDNFLRRCRGWKSPEKIYSSFYVTKQHIRYPAIYLPLPTIFKDLIESYANDLHRQKLSNKYYDYNPVAQIDVITMYDRSESGRESAQKIYDYLRNYQVWTLQEQPGLGTPLWIRRSGFQTYV